MSKHVQGCISILFKMWTETCLNMSKDLFPFSLKCGLKNVQECISILFKSDLFSSQHQMNNMYMCCYCIAVAQRDQQECDWLINNMVMKKLLLIFIQKCIGFRQYFCCNADSLGTCLSPFCKLS